MIEKLSPWRYQTGVVVADFDDTLSPDFAGTFTTIAWSVQEATFIVAVPKVAAPDFPKPVPLIVTVVPALPWFGDSLVICAPATGGVTTGGLVTGGLVTGGVVTGGVTTGGVVTGGVTTGGVTTGGVTTGGVVTGGVVTGGVVTGGVVTGGVVTGGVVGAAATVML